MYILGGVSCLFFINLPQKTTPARNRDVLVGEIVNTPVSVKNWHRICMHKFSWAVAQTHRDRKEKIRM